MPHRPSLENFLKQAEACDELGSPFTAALCRLLVHTIDDGSAFGRPAGLCRSKRPRR